MQEEEEERPAVTFSCSPERDLAPRRKRSSDLCRARPLLGHLSPIFLLLLLTSINRWLAGGKGSSQSCLSSTPPFFCFASLAFFLRSLLFHGWLLLILLFASIFILHKTREVLDGGCVTKCDKIIEGMVHEMCRTCVKPVVLLQNVTRVKHLFMFQINQIMFSFLFNLGRKKKICQIKSCSQKSPC